MPPADAPGFCKEICRFQRPKSGAVNAKTKSILAFTIFTNRSLVTTEKDFACSACKVLDDRPYQSAYLGVYKEKWYC